MDNIRISEMLPAALADVKSNGLIPVAVANTENYKVPVSDFATKEQGAAADSAYQKPPAGIPKADLAVDVQTSLGKADTALQPGDISGLATQSALAAETAARIAADTNLAGDISGLGNELQDHKSNTDVHVTPADKAKWDAAGSVAADVVVKNPASNQFISVPATTNFQVGSSNKRFGLAMSNDPSAYSELDNTQIIQRGSDIVAEVRGAPFSTKLSMDSTNAFVSAQMGTSSSASVGVKQGLSNISGIKDGSEIGIEADVSNAQAYFYLKSGSTKQKMLGISNSSAAPPYYVGLSVFNNAIKNVGTPVGDSDAATKKYVDDAVAGASGGTRYEHHIRLNDTANNWYVSFTLHSSTPTLTTANIFAAIGDKAIAASGMVIVSSNPYIVTLLSLDGSKSFLIASGNNIYNGQSIALNLGSNPSFNIFSRQI